MASIAAEFPSPNKMSFPGPIGTKRRRMRSGGNVSTLTNNTLPPIENISEEKTTQTSKCKGANTIPIFLKKTYKMIDTCDPDIASWTPDGEMFVVKDPDLFATQIIPQYFDHNKFSSFARQLNFYGFRKMQSKPIRNSDFDAGTAKHVTFYNENFKRGRCDLLKKIQRSTRGGPPGTPQDAAKEVQNLRDQVMNLEQQMSEMSSQFEDRLRRLELDMLARMEQMMLSVQQQQSTQMQLQKAASVGSTVPSSSSSQQQQSQQPLQQQPPQQHMATQQSWDPASLGFIRGNSVQSVATSIGMNSVVGAAASIVNGNSVGFQPQHHQQPQAQMNKMAAPPTLPPHPKQKQLPLNGLPPMVDSFGRLNSLRGISQLARGLSRGASVESSSSAVLMRNSWEDKFFSMLMLDANDQISNAVGNSMNPTPIGDASSNNQATLAPHVVSNRSVDFNHGGNHHPHEDSGDLSSVSSSDIP